MILPLFGLLFAICGSSASAEESGGLDIRIDEKLIYCAATLKERDSGFIHALKDGIPVTTVWNIQVDKIREYWMNKAIAEITLVRRVVPDLLSRSWILEDQASGISRKVYSMDAVGRFLTHLEYLPVLDRSLLAASTPYMMRVDVEMHTGEVNDGWWGNLLRPEQISMQKEFSLQ